jgi:hypothetical protein
LRPSRPSATRSLRHGPIARSEQVNDGVAFGRKAAIAFRRLWTVGGTKDRATQARAATKAEGRATAVPSYRLLTEEETSAEAGAKERNTFLPGYRRELF